MPFVFFVLLSFALLILLSGLLVFVLGCVRRKEINWLNESEIKGTHYEKFYRYILAGDRFLKEHNAKPLQICSDDGLLLYADFVPAENPKGTIILAHGYRSNKVLEFGKVFDFYHNKGLNILTVDQRAHGKSEGKYITFGVKESTDMQAWIRYHNEHIGQYPIILSGLSMGASTMLYLADADLPDNVRGIIADCGFTSPKEIIGTVYQRTTHLPSALSLWAADLFTRLLAGFSLTEKDTTKSLANSKIPVMMVHGVADGFVPCDMTRRGYDACTGKKTVLLVEGADHGLSFLVDRPRYTQMVTDFLKENLEGIQ
mgnify:CR=1 FL=1